ncbi:MAG: DUF1566 domain-containing protein [Desulfamplus sp.]|nr:DUF1566 domain-containing protein [Desulfamplus sp.]
MNPNKIFAILITAAMLLFVQSAHAQQYPHPVPDTGQTQSYTDTFGEDSDYTTTTPSPSYTKLDAGGNTLSDSATSWAMVKDNYTGLIWENKTDDGSIHDKDNTYTWQNAQDVFIANLNANAFGGYTDWRLPTIKELGSIVNYGRYNPAIDVSYFSDTMSSYYWSATTGAGDTAGAWLIHFDDGLDPFNGKSSSYYVRAVRAGQ